MKSSVFILFAILSYVMSYASSNNLTFPKGEDSYLIHQSILDPATFSPGAGGENMFWIMDSLQSHKTFMVDVYYASQFQLTGGFKQAELVIENEYVSTNALNFGHIHYFIYKTLDNALVKIGRIDTDTVLNESYNTYFPDPEIKTDNLVYYNQSKSDTWNASYVIPSTNQTVDWKDGQTQYLVDASGEMRINGEFLKDIFRIKRIKDYTETVNSSLAVEHHIESYEWWSTSVAFPIFSMELHTTSDSVNTFTVSYLDKSHYVLQGVEDQVSEVPSIKIFPNPSNGQIHVSYEVFKSGTIQVSLIDITGSEVKSFENKEIMSGTYEQDYILDVQPGVYFLKTTLNGKSNTSKLIVT